MLVIPHKIHRANRTLPKQKYKQYEMGFGLNVTGGVTHERWRFGLGGIYKKNKASFLKVIVWSEVGIPYPAIVRQLAGIWIWRISTPH